MRTEETVDELCRKWQTILRLRDWDIHVELFLAREFSGEDRQGRIRCCWIYNVLNRRDVTANDERIFVLRRSARHYVEVSACVLLTHSRENESFDNLGVRVKIRRPIIPVSIFV